MGQPMNPLRFLAYFVLLLLSPAGAADLTLMSFNVWKQGSQVEDGLKKEVSAIRLANADVVCLQESTPEHADKVAAALGWTRAGKGSGTTQIITRHKIGESFGTDRCMAARILISAEPEQEVVVFNCHLDHRFYGPYAARVAGATATGVLQEEARSDREEQINGFLKEMAPFIEKSSTTPVFLTGDFNCPSHLDWTDATADKHGGVGRVEWPVSMAVAAAGFTDTFRFLHPDPVKEPGESWSTIHKETEPQDRIDFIHHAGKGVTPLTCRLYATEVQRTVGAWTEARLSEVAGNTWPSDHFAVLATFRITR
ncbi:MAG: endonuclease/exonuclease/phosphatase family protein [Verrucomicrobiaceae bacterium]|nr:MAG: endonuclease/exonuclease/phosphatase family protein [Verrucomicrobiaceae bacterium]